MHTSYRRAGLDAHELVLLHGQPGSAADWQQVTGRLPARLHPVATDRPGYGSSQLPAGGFAVNARAVVDDLDSRGITRAVLVGHSYGGGVALSAASLAPGRVAAVVLLASVGPGCLPDARLQLVEGAGHHLPRRAPEAVADAIVAFLPAARINDVPITQPAAT